ncbi:MAG: chemotaxis protein CheA [Deltaproteobacteria bacterium]|nr:chemotaxis protein CheA [Deltaproteobacteria bacterium]
MMDSNQQKATIEFLAEGEEILEGIGNNLVHLEEGIGSARINPEIINGIFRGAHSLKGLSGMLGFTKVSELSHNLENMLDSLRLGKLKLAPPVLDCLFESLDTLNGLILKIGEEGNDDLPIEDALARIEAVLHADTEGAQEESLLKTCNISPAVIEVLTEYEEHRLLANIEQGDHLYKIRISFDLATFDQDLQKLTAGLSEIGEIITTLPSTGDSPESGIQFTLIVGSQEEQEKVVSVISAFESAEIEEINYAPVKDSEPPTPTETAPARGSENFVSDIKGLTRTVRVDIGKLDHLMNVVGELIQSKDILKANIKTLRQAEAQAGLANSFHQAVEVLERKLTELQDGVLEVRMIPIGQIFNRLNRIVRKLSHDAGKQIRFATSGEDTELDKMVIEELADPLMHIIRNAIDHGIETPEVRKAAGKQAEGTIELRAYQEGNHVIIEVEEDGAGIDVKKIREKAIEKGLVEEDESMTEEETLNLIFLPGFSTAEKVSEVSGRGVGMDVAKKNITLLGGMIDIDTEPGEGTLFTITLPITLAIIPALIVQCTDQIFAIPLNAVTENLILPRQSIQTIEQREVIKLRGRTLPLIRLQEAFRLPGDNSRSMEKSHIVVAGLAEKKIGIIVDDFLDKQEIVIKAVGRTLKGIPGIAGATELGDKQAVLVLDVGALIEEATRKAVAE